MEALHAMMTELTSQMNAMMDRFNTRLDKVAAARSRPSSSIPPTPQTPPPQSDPPAAATQQQPSSPAKKKQNKRTRQQYKRRALHVTVQPSVKEVEHTEQKKPSEHVVLQRIKLVPWDWSTTSLWCWHAVIPWDGMTMVLLRCGASGMPRIGIGWSQQRSDGPYLNDLGSSEVLVQQQWPHSFNSWSISWQHIISRGSSGSHSSRWPYTSVFLTRIHSFLDGPLTSQLASEIAARTLAFFQKGGICYGIFDHMDVGLVITSLGARFSVLSWRTHLDQNNSYTPHSLLNHINIVPWHYYS